MKSIYHLFIIFYTDLQVNAFFHIFKRFLVESFKADKHVHATSLSCQFDHMLIISCVYRSLHPPSSCVDRD